MTVRSASTERQLDGLAADLAGQLEGAGAAGAESSSDEHENTSENYDVGAEDGTVMVAGTDHEYGKSEYLSGPYGADATTGC